MNKSGIVDALAERANLSKKDARAVVDELFNAEDGVIARSLRQGDKVTISGFGSFEVRERGPRTARNPRTGQEMKVAASKAPAFRAGRGLKDTIGTSGAKGRKK
jgi:nucleoid DNA-binding protein